MNEGRREVTAQLFNSSIQTGEIPWEWGNATIVPLFKSEIHVELNHVTTDHSVKQV